MTGLLTSTHSPGLRLVATASGKLLYHFNPNVSVVFSFVIFLQFKTTYLIIVLVMSVSCQWIVISTNRGPGMFYHSLPST